MHSVGTVEPNAAPDSSISRCLGTDVKTSMMQQLSNRMSKSPREGIPSVAMITPPSSEFSHQSDNSTMKDARNSSFCIARNMNDAEDAPT